MIGALAGLAAGALAGVLPGTYTNEEQVEFARAKGAALPPWVGVEVRREADGALGMMAVDAHGQTGAADAGWAPTVTADGLALVLKDGTAVTLLRARAFRCWASIPKRVAKADGSPDWWFKAGLAVHDRGGRLAVATDEAVPQRFSLRMRNVVFPEPPNRPSLVLYVHGDDPVRALSYAWADPDAKRVGINLRTVQASCSLAE